MVDVMGTHVKYVMDNSKVKGFGGLLLSGGVQKVALSVAGVLSAQVALSAAAAESNARRWSIRPGWITEAYSGGHIRPTVITIMDGGHRNPRRSARLEVSTPHGNDNGGLVESSAVTLEFGSHYNEGTKTDRPALGVLGTATRRLLALGLAERVTTAKTTHVPMYIKRG